VSCHGNGTDDLLYQDIEEVQGVTLGGGTRGAPPQLRAVARWRARPDGAELEEGCIRRKKTPTGGHVLALSCDWSYNSATHF
jgi:hypothetical protein